MESGLTVLWSLKKKQLLWNNLIIKHCCIILSTLLNLYRINWILTKQQCLIISSAPCTRSEWIKPWSPVKLFSDREVTGNALGLQKCIQPHLLVRHWQYSWWWGLNYGGTFLVWLHGRQSLQNTQFILSARNLVLGLFADGDQSFSSQWRMCTVGKERGPGLPEKRNPSRGRH